EGAIGCFEEACRNVVCTGAKPIGMVDHLQFGNPEDPEIFWTFLESLKGLTDFAKFFKIPCVGGKVSFYNETPNGPIKPSPLIGVLGLIDDKPLRPQSISQNDLLVMIGNTKNELGGSEYFEYIHNFVGGICPVVDFEISKTHMNAVLELIKKNLVKVVHDCSKGGLGIAISELAMQNKIGCKISLEDVPGEKLSDDRVLFSESHSRYLLVIARKNLKQIQSFLERKAITYNVIGKFMGDQIIFQKNSNSLIKLSVDKAQKSWMKSLGELVLHG
ncbi:MAG: AIR synthase-related protein, partial [Nitrosopumilaceae archaeon]